MAQVLLRRLACVDFHWGARSGLAGEQIVSKELSGAQTPLKKQRAPSSEAKLAGLEHWPLTKHGCAMHPELGSWCLPPYSVLRTGQSQSKLLAVFATRPLVRDDPNGSATTLWQRAFVPVLALFNGKRMT